MITRSGEALVKEALVKKAGFITGSWSLAGRLAKRVGTMGLRAASVARYPAKIIGRGTLGTARLAGRGFESFARLSPAGKAMVLGGVMPTVFSGYSLRETLEKNMDRVPPTIPIIPERSTRHYERP